MEETHAYLCARVDPVMGSLVLALMEGRPEDTHEAALKHLLSKRLGKDGPADDQQQMGTAVVRPEGQNRVKGGGDNRAASSAPADNEGGKEVAQHHRLARRQDRLFMAREIGPLVTELIRRTLHHMPADVESFLIEQLQGGIAPGFACSSTAAARENVVNNNRTPHPPTSNGVDDPPDSRKNRPTRPSTARSRLQHAQSLDFHVQQTSPPQSGRAAEARPRSPSSPRGLKNGALSDEEDGVGDQGGGSASLRSEGGGGRGVVAGVKESQNKPWDVEVSSELKAPPFEEPRPPSNSKPQLAVILLLGLDGSGKTTLLGTLQGEKDPRVRPSVGFKPVTMMLSDQLKVKFYDLGGGENIRSIWDKYYHDAHGLLYVVDGADGARWEQSKDLFVAATSHKYLQGKPVAVILNKEDAGLQVAPEEVAGGLGLSSRRDAKVCCCSVNASKAKGGEVDQRLEGTVEWLLGSIQESFAGLNERVQHDLQDMEREFQLEKERKQLQVMRGLLRKAFPETEGVEREDCFDEAEGLEFLASEVGLEPGELEAEGAEIAALVGYQKLALQMVGNMKSPISRKNRARSWGEIRQLIVDLRREAGIDV
eukprot:g16690.t1